MKISTFILFMVLVSGIFFIFSEGVRESNEQYPQANINSSTWNSRYDYSDQMSSTIQPLQDKLKTIEDTNAGWFTRISAGIVAIPYAVILIPRVGFNSIYYAGDMVSGFFQALNLPGKVVSIVLLMISIWLIFKLAGFFQRTDI